jgi:hypothetical protein
MKFKQIINEAWDPVPGNKKSFKKDEVKYEELTQAIAEKTKEYIKDFFKKYKIDAYSSIVGAWPSDTIGYYTSPGFGEMMCTTSSIFMRKFNLSKGDAKAKFSIGIRLDTNVYDRSWRLDFDEGVDYQELLSKAERDRNYNEILNAFKDFKKSIDNGKLGIDLSRYLEEYKPSLMDKISSFIWKTAFQTKEEKLIQKEFNKWSH